METAKVNSTSINKVKVHTDAISTWKFWSAAFMMFQRPSWHNTFNH